MRTGGFPEPYTFGRRLVAYFKRHKPDYDIVHDNQSLCYGTLQLQKLGVPLLTTIHHPITSDLRIALASESSWRMRLLIKRWHSFLGMQKKVVPALDHLVTVSKASRGDISKAFHVAENDINIVHNGIDTDLFQPPAEPDRNPMRIMATASADAPLKGLKYLLGAIAKLREMLQQVRETVAASERTVDLLRRDTDTQMRAMQLKVEANADTLYKQSRYLEDIEQRQRGVTSLAVTFKHDARTKRNRLIALSLMF